METKQAQTTHKHTGQDSFGLLGSIPCELVRASTPRPPAISNMVAAGFLLQAATLRRSAKSKGREELEPLRQVRLIVNEGEPDELPLAFKEEHRD